MHKLMSRRERSMISEQWHRYRSIHFKIGGCIFSKCQNGVENSKAQKTQCRLRNKYSRLEKKVKLTLCRRWRYVDGDVELHSLHPSIHPWRCNPFCALVSLRRRLHSSLSSTPLLHPLFLRSVMCPSGRRPPILFLVFPLGL